MISHELREFVDRVMDNKTITENDVQHLQRNVMADEVMTRDAVDVLVALDRALPEACPAFGDHVVALVVDFTVWESRPTGNVDREKAQWLLTTLSAGEGPTANARRIAFEIVREAERCDESLIGFAMAASRRPRSVSTFQPLALAS